jgi:hypothetical protein
MPASRSGIGLARTFRPMIAPEHRALTPVRLQCQQRQRAGCQPGRRNREGRDTG